MALTLNGSTNTIAGVAVGGLPDGIVDTDMLAANAVAAAKSNISGSIVNVAQVVKYNTASTSVAEGAYSEALLSLSYAAASGSNKLLIIANCSVSTQTAANIWSTLFINGSASAFRGDAASNRQRVSSGSPESGSATNISTQTIIYLLSSPSTSSVAYDVRVGHAQDATQNVYINRTHGDSDSAYMGRPASSITILEVAA